jgi:F-type H+-transporting ATPase subunit b
MVFPALFADIIQNLAGAGQQTGWNTQQFFAQCLAVTVLFIVLWRFAWKPVLTILEERRQKIAESMANADRIRKELADAEATRLSIIQKANEKAKAIIAEAEASALTVNEQRLKEGARQADDLVKNAHAAAEIDRNRLMAELKQHLGELVIQTTEKVAGKVLNADDQARLNRETVQQVEASRN